ncbi:hypothetical protein [Lignipirellula cremea]|uniref:C2 domain protein n=1 Tax=Lignipirellula cremea TaxID=2528010 RepID=A0A518DMX3_9BACT|nr:hypothetical protein [Lignipirellula cremea]QDU93188.1 hypothetical protein Pla8534_09670 [Lignipirellula cremea]
MRYLLLWFTAIAAGLSFQTTAAAESPGTFHDPLAELVAESPAGRQLECQIRRQLQPNSSANRPRRALLTIQSVEAAPTRAGGSTWERASWIPEPDLKVIAICHGETTQRYVTAVVQDSCTAAFDEAAFSVEEGDILHLWVYDNDCLCDDKVGDLRIECTEKLLAEGRGNFSFGQVRSLTVLFSPIQP